MGYFNLFHLKLFSTIVSYIWLLYVFFCYCTLFHFKLLIIIISYFFVILNYFILGYFQLCEIIIGYFFILNVISPYVIIGDFRLL